MGFLANHIVSGRVVGVGWKTAALGAGGVAVFPTQTETFVLTHLAHMRITCITRDEEWNFFSPILK